jgi:hypothetical protein
MEKNEQNKKPFRQILSILKNRTIKLSTDYTEKPTNFPMKNKHRSPALIAIMLAVAALALAGCGKSGDPAAAPASPGGAGKPIDENAFSIKYKADDAIYIFTKNADGSQKRLDSISTHDDHTHHTVLIWDRKGGSNKQGVVCQYEDGAWTEIPRSEGNSINMKAIRAEQGINNYYSDPVRDLTKYYVHEKVGFTKRPGVAIAGRNCDVYGGVRPKDTGGLPRYGALNLRGPEEEIAVWNGLTMRLKYTQKKEDGGIYKETVALEALAVTFSVPKTSPPPPSPTPAPVPMTPPPPRPQTPSRSRRAWTPAVPEARSPASISPLLPPASRAASPSSPVSPPPAPAKPSPCIIQNPSPTAPCPSSS